VLAASALPFLQHRGVFIPSARAVTLGQRFFILLRINTDDIEVATGLGSVCWITPEGSSDGRSPGFGLHFDSDAIELQRMLEVAISGEKDDHRVQES
jgi:type IV pilus assembly protein PilZ